MNPVSVVLDAQVNVLDAQWSLGCASCGAELVEVGPGVVAYHCAGRCRP